MSLPSPSARRRSRARGARRATGPWANGGAARYGAGLLALMALLAVVPAPPVAAQDGPLATKGSIPDLSLATGQDPFDLLIFVAATATTEANHLYFASDLTITYSVESGKVGVVAAALHSDLHQYIRLTPRAAGTATITLTATVGTGADTATATQTFVVTVVPPLVTERADYDTDNDGLIEIEFLEQLDALRWDMDGNGAADDSANNAAYKSAFGLQSRNRVSGCLNNACTGYELMHSLDFSRNGSYASGRVNTSWTAGGGWTPLGQDGPGRSSGTQFTAVLQGNGHSISNLLINRLTSGGAGLFWQIGSGGKVESLGLPSVNVSGHYQVGALASQIVGGSVVNVHVSGAVTGKGEVGGLAGAANAGAAVLYSSSSAAVRVVDGTNNGDTDYDIGGLLGVASQSRVAASWATGSVGSGDAALGSSSPAHMGGLVGNIRSGSVMVASYATGAVSGRDATGGLVGAADHRDTNFSMPEVRASYATGRVQGRFAFDTRGLVGGRVYRVTMTASYYDTNTSGRSRREGPKTTAELQTPTGYTGIYANWDVDVDGDGTSDDPWNFGSSTQYPVIKNPHVAVVFPDELVETQLIPVSTLAQLNAIRYDLDGDGAVEIDQFDRNNDGDLEDPQDDSAGHATAVTAYAAAFDSVPCTVNLPCDGYRLTADLDFDTGTAGVRTDDAYDNSGAGWVPIGGNGAPYEAEFDGGGHTVSNLFIDRLVENNVGLFGVVGGDGLVVGLNLTGADVAGHRNVGAMIGHLSGGAGRALSSDGVVSGDNNVGGLVGRNAGFLAASYSNAAVFAARFAGGLAGRNLGAIAAAYATGPVAAEINTAGGLVGRAQRSGGLARPGRRSGDRTVPDPHRRRLRPRSPGAAARRPARHGSDDAVRRLCRRTGSRHGRPQERCGPAAADPHDRRVRRRRARPGTRPPDSRRRAAGAGQSRHMDHRPDGGRAAADPVPGAVAEPVRRQHLHRSQGCRFEPDLHGRGGRRRRRPAHRAPPAGGRPGRYLPGRRRLCVRASGNPDFLQCRWPAAPRRFRRPLDPARRRHLLWRGRRFPGARIAGKRGGPRGCRARGVARRGKRADRSAIRRSGGDRPTAA